MEKLIQEARNRVMHNRLIQLPNEMKHYSLEQRIDLAGYERGFKAGVEAMQAEMLEVIQLVLAGDLR